MKKLMAMVLACCLLLGSAALAESPAEESVKLTYEELQMYMTALREDALKEGNVSIISSQDGPTMAVTAVGNLTIADEQLTQTTAVVGAQLAAGVACPRGVMVGHSLADVLAAYPNDNPDLMGTYYDAALFVSGEKPEASVGWVLRDGQRVTEVTYAVFHWTGEDVIRCGVTYSLDQGEVTDIEVFGMDSAVSEEDALAEIQNVAQMQENTGYFAYPQSQVGTDLSMFQREDLSFAGLDLLDLTPETAIAVLGDAPVDEWTQDSNGEWMRLREWEGATALFVYSADKQFLRLDTLTLENDQLEGPRGVRVGDYMDSVIRRFRHNEGSRQANGNILLYGDGQAAPYGVVSYGETSASITYTQAVEDKTVIWQLTFTDGELETMIFMLR